MEVGEATWRKPTPEATEKSEKFTGDGNCGAVVAGRGISSELYDFPVCAGVGVGVCAVKYGEKIKLRHKETEGKTAAFHDFF